MKILQINAVYGMGSTGKIARDISQKLLECGHESYIMWATGCNKCSDGTKLIRIGNTLDHKLHALLYRFFAGQGMYSRLATKKACKKISHISPDVVHLHNLHSNYIHLPTLFKFLAKQNIPTLITMHDCWFVSGHCTNYKNHNCESWLTDCKNCPAVKGYQKKAVEKIFTTKKQLFENHKSLAINGVSQWTTQAARQSILKTATNFECIYNWVDTNVYKPSDNTKQTRQKYNIPENKKLILGVSQSWSSSKGLDSFIMLAEKLKNKAHVILVGKNDGVPKTQNLDCVGFTSDLQELIDLYTASDVLVNASGCETFGLVTVESMACGTPVVAYDNSGSSELITKECGYLAKDGDKDELLKQVENLLAKSKEEFSSACRQYVCKNFEKSTQIQKYIEFYKKISNSDF